MTSASGILRRLRRTLRRRQLMRYASYSLPLAIPAGFVAVDLGGGLFDALLWPIVVMVVMTLSIDVARSRQRVTASRVAAHLDRRFDTLEDSSQLLLSAPGSLSAPARLQRARVARRLEALADAQAFASSAAQRTARSWAAGLLVAAVIVNAMTWWPGWRRSSSDAAPAQAATAELVRFQFDIRPRSYTGRAAFALSAADVVAPEFSELRFTAWLTGDAPGPVLELPGGRVETLYAAGDGRWQTDWWPAEPGSWRVVDDRGATVRRGDGLDFGTLALVADEPPSVSIRQPDRRLHEIDALPFSLPVTIEANDDYGIADVRMSATRATGSGERVSFEGSDRLLFDGAAMPEASVRQTLTLDAAALGLEPGAEVYVHFEARDRRPVSANTGRSQTLILRWRSPASDAAPILGSAAIQVMPDYFRSQRQIIIDSEQLLTEAEAIDRPQYRQRAQSLAFDQQALRLRYGQFLGEEVGGLPDALPAQDDGDEAAADGEHYAGDGHDHGEDFEPAAPATRFGDAEAAIEPYAHFHDREEQATLFDPETRELLRSALRAMWRAEGELRQFRPERSLPHQYEALALIKRVQNRSRSYARRVGFETTPVDPGRRLTGELDDIDAEGRMPGRADATNPLLVADAAARVLAGDAHDGDRELLTAWLEQQAEAAGAADELETAQAAGRALAALEQWRNEPACAPCRTQFATAWRLLAPTPPRPAARRDAPLNAFETPGAGS